MGFYFRKSIQFGPLRFNLSKSGIGVSAGVKGLRFGTGPRGNYIQMGRDGIYYRKTLPNARSVQSVPYEPQTPSPPKQSWEHCEPSVEIGSADVSGMADSSSAQLLKELNTKRKRLRFAPLSTILFGISVLYLIAESVPTPSHYMASVGLAILAIMAFWMDQQRKTTCLWYEFDPAVEAAYTSLHKAASTIASCSQCWHVEASSTVYDRKYHGGASSLVRRSQTVVRTALPAFLKTNVKTVAIDVGRQTLYFFPDRLLVFDHGRVGAVDYCDVTLDVSSRKFIEDGYQPQDARVVDYTWAYVNKDGSPDQRFNGNRRLPVCLYDELHFSSSSGLNELIQTSRDGIANPLASAIRSLAHYTKGPFGGQPIFTTPRRPSHLASFIYVAMLLGTGAVIFTGMRPHLATSTPQGSSAEPTTRVDVVPAPQSPAANPDVQTPPRNTTSESTTKTAASFAPPNPENPKVPSVLTIQKFATVEDAQREAVRRYPELGVRGSKLNAAFLARYKTYKQLKPEYFADLSWPVRLAEEVFETQKVK